MFERQRCWSEEERSATVFNGSIQRLSVQTLGDASDVSEQEVFPIAQLIHWSRIRCHPKTPRFPSLFAP